jgi:type I restriction enzyme, S subunit
MSLPKYLIYKDSGVRWIGQVPTHWKIDRIKASIISSRNGIWGDEPQEDETDIACVRVADFDRNKLEVKPQIPTIRSVTEKERNGRLLRRGDLLLEKSGGGELQPVGQVVMYQLDVPAVCSNFVSRVILKPSMSSGYWKYVHNAAYSVGVNLGSINQTSGIQNLDQDRYFNESAPFPPQPEQSAIAAFLDRETAKIDTLIAEQEKLIDLLAEKRQATISHAVTKGLNPNAPMIDSGVAWLGKVPAHWIKSPIKHALVAIIDTEHKTIPFYEDGGFLVARTSNIKNGNLETANAKYTDEKCFIEWTARGVPEPGDIILTREAPAGEACIVPPELPLCLGQRTVLLKVNKSKLRARYGLWSIYGGLAAEFVAVLSQGSTVAHFNMSDIGNIPMLLPPLDEQDQLVAFIDGEIAKLDRLSANSKRVIELLKERRSALVAAAVTGKIDLRSAISQAKAAIPEAIAA